jgi:hypothetical protein
MTGSIVSSCPLTQISALLGATAATVGMFLSFHVEIASGPAIVLISSAGVRGPAQRDQPRWRGGREPRPQHDPRPVP